MIGITMHLADLTPHGLDVSRCCSPDAIAAARAVAARLGVPHHLIDEEQTFHGQVIEPFLDAYRAGETPSPCIRCNSRVKFPRLLALAEQFGADAVATGHYARRRHLADGSVRIRRALETARDQSYFLFELSPPALERILFPLGTLPKGEVREIARRLGLASAERRDSQEVCFVPRGCAYPLVVERLAGDRLRGPGPIVTTDGEVIGRHQGIHHFTVGQRRGLGVSGRERRYVVAIDAEHNTVIAGSREEACASSVTLAQVLWHDGEPAAPRHLAVQVRSRHEPAPAEVTPLPGGRARVSFEEPVSAPAPGQAAVFYQDDTVVGGGWIEGRVGPVQVGAVGRGVTNGRGREL